MKICIGSREIAADRAADWLVNEYNRQTVEYYDYAAKRSPDDARSPTSEVVLEDLGRMVCVAASLTYSRGQTLMTAGSTAHWPEIEVPALNSMPGEVDAFMASPPVESLWRLFRHFDEYPDLGHGTIGKLLHVKWPHFLPITDSEFRNVYRTRAVELHNASVQIQTELKDTRPRRNRANVRAYWLAFRNDLVSGEEGLKVLRERIASQVGVDDPHDAHICRLLDLTDVRILDALVWGIGANRL